MQPSQILKTRFQHLAGLLAAGIYFLLLYVYYPFRETFEFDLDEGVEAMKAMLLGRGIPLYSQIWSEQPPLMTYLLAASFRLFGFEVDVGRVLVLVFASVLVGSAWYLLEAYWGAGHAVAGVTTIFLLPYFARLSVSLMIGLPAITLATVALAALLFWHRQRRGAWLVLSAIALSLSVLTKLYTGFLAPIFLLGLYLGEPTPEPALPDHQRRFIPALTWGLWFAGTGLGLSLLLVGPGNIPQLVETHLLARDIDRYSVSTGAYRITPYLLEAWPIVALALIGAALAWRKNPLFTFYTGAWAATAYVLLLFHQPVWYHHTPLVTVPLALFTAVAVGEGLKHLYHLLRRTAPLSRLTPFALLVVIGIVFMLGNRVPEVIPDLQRPPFFITGAAHTPWVEQMFLVKMSNHATKTNWVLTNLPMYAFRVGLPVPPYLAVMSEKRLATRQLSEAQIIAVLNEYQAEQVLIGRREFPELEDYLQQDYKLLYERGKRLLYVRKELKQ